MRSLSLETYNGLVDAIYEAAHTPEKWPAFLSAISGSLGGVWTSLHCSDTKTGLCIAMAGDLYDPSFVESLHREYGVINPWLDAVQQMPVGKAQTSESLIEPDLLRQTRFYNEWIRPQEDIGTGAGITIARDRQRLLRLSCNIRFRDQEKIQADLADLLDLLAPHLARCFAVSRHLRGHRLGAGATLDVLPASIFLVDDKGHVLYANKAGESLRRESRLLSYDGAGRLVVSDPEADDALQRRLHAITGQDHTASTGPILLRDQDSNRMVPMTVAPLTSRTDALAGMLGWPDGDPPVAIVCLDWSGVVDREALFRAHGLTPAEGDLASALQQGATLKSHAVQRGVSYHTMRKHLSAAFRKTGTTQQSQLVALLSNGRNHDPAIATERRPAEN